MRKVTHYLNCDKDDVREQCKEEGVVDDEGIVNVIGAVYEVEFTIDADTGTILAVHSGKQHFNSTT